MKATVRNVFQRPESQSDISDLANRLLREAGAIGVLPTPMENLIACAQVNEFSELPCAEDGFLERLSSEAQAIFRTAYQKIRGMADLRKRINYVPPNGHKSRIRFARGHELGHQVLPWHRVDGGYLDRDKELSPHIKNVFEAEANFFSAEVIFQGRRFQTKARDYVSSFNAIFSLANEHEASYQATIWRFVEEQDEAVAVAYYYPTFYFDNHGQKILKLWKLIPSPKFKRRYGDIVLPENIQSNHHWASARHYSGICEGDLRLDCGGRSIPFTWETWWNGYTLFVLIRRRPPLRIVRSIFGD